MDSRRASTKKSQRFSGNVETVIETYIVIPPDGGWGWVVVCVSFFFNFICDGIIYTFGIFLLDISKGFEASKPQVSLANSLMTGFSSVLG